MNYMPRYGWRAKPGHMKDVDHFHRPVDYLVVTVTAINDDCSTHEECCQAVKTAQEYDMDLGKELSYKTKRALAGQYFEL